MIIKGNKEELFQQTATIIENKIKLLRGKVTLAVPGGRSVEGIFNYLKDKNIDWKRIHIFMVDERKVKLSSKLSNFRILKTHLTKHIQIPESNIHPFRMEKGIKAYEIELKKIKNNYDIILLSSGEDGHIGALYPNHHSINNNNNFFIEMNDSPKKPPKRMSASKNLIKKSKTAILLFIGESKRDAFNRFKDSSIKEEQCPAKLVNDIKDHYILTDLE